MQASQTRHRHDWLHIARAIACLMVVLTHTAAPFLFAYGDVDPSSWWIANLIKALCRVSVPIFFMISGFLFLTGRAPQWRHLRRLLIAFSFYTALAIGFRFATYDENPLLTLISAYQEPALYHLWFFYPLIALYLIAMLVQMRLTASAGQIAVILILMVALNPSVSTLWSGEGTENAFGLSGHFLTYLLFAFAGALIGTLAQQSSLPRRPWSFLAAYAAIAMLIAQLTAYRSRPAGELLWTYFDNSNVLLIVAGLSIFAALATMPAPGGRVGRFLRHVADHSLAIFGLHALFLSTLSAFGLRLWGHAALEIPVVFAATFGLSLLCARGLRKMDPERLFT